MQIDNRNQLVKDMAALFRRYQNKQAQIESPIDIEQAIERTLEDNRLLDKNAETKHITILLSDLRGFTGMAEKFPPLRVIELLNHYFKKMSEIIDQHGGLIDKFMGDSIMVLFGAIKHSPKDLTNAIHCAIEMQIAMTDINQIAQSLEMPKLYMGIGINTGEVVAGTLGSDIYREYTVIGDQVNLASRVEAHSLRGQVLLTESSFQLAKQKIAVGYVNEVMVKGKSQPVKMYELLALTQPEIIQVPRRDIRKSPRVDIKIPVTFQKIKNKVVEPHYYSGQMVDLSYGGLFIKTNEDLSQFSDVKMTVALSLMAEDHSDIYARVLRSDRIAQMFEVHLEFTGLSEEARQAIKTYVDRSIE